MAKANRTPGDGKKIDTVYYDVRQVVPNPDKDEDRKIYRKVAIDIYMLKKFDTSPEAPAPAATTAIGFKVRCEEANIEMAGSDIDACLKYVRSKLDEIHSIKWEPWLLVRVTPERPVRGIGAGLSLSWDDVERGVTFDGSVLMKRFNSYAEWGKRWQVEPWPRTLKEAGKIVAVIPATEANKDALNIFMNKINDLRVALAALVAPDKIEETLSQIANSQLALIGNAK